MSALAAIVERDRMAIHGDDDTPDHMQATTDRGDLLALLRETRDALGRSHPHDDGASTCGACETYNRLEALGAVR